MNLHEYQGKQILARNGVVVPAGYVAFTAGEAVKNAKRLQEETGTEFWVIKAQIHAGGRGKGGGVKLARSLEEVRTLSEQIIGMRLVTPQTPPEGRLVKKVLVQQDVYYPGESEIQEFYMSIMLNRRIGRNVIVYSPDGGMDIEHVAEMNPERIFTEVISPETGIMPFQMRKIAFNLGLSGKAFKNMLTFVESLYNAYIGVDASLLEINPVLKTSDNQVMAVDAKVVAENSSLFRHPDIEAMYDVDEDDPSEVEAAEAHLNFVKLNGNVGCMVNGAGLAMATMDIIKMSGGDPANFLDVGGTASAERVEKAFRIILKDKNVKVILVNIFGGIVRCDRVANGIIDAYRNIGDIPVPIIVRLQGTNAAEAKQLIDESGLKVLSAVGLDDAARLITESLG